MEFANLRKAAVSFGMSVPPSVWDNSAPSGRVYMKSDISIFLKNLSRKGFIEIDRNNAHFIRILAYIFDSMSLNSCLLNVSDKRCREIKTHFMFTNFFPKIVPFMRLTGKIW